MLIIQAYLVDNILGKRIFFLRGVKCTEHLHYVDSIVYYL